MKKTHPGLLILYQFHPRPTCGVTVLLSILQVRRLRVVESTRPHMQPVSGSEVSCQLEERVQVQPDLEEGDGRFPGSPWRTRVLPCRLCLAVHRYLIFISYDFAVLKCLVTLNCSLSASLSFGEGRFDPKCDSEVVAPCCN